MTALIAGLLVPGAGQAYNGQVLAAFGLLLISPLLVPWIWGAIAAHRRAQTIAEQGGRDGRGGPWWIVLQLWLQLVVVGAVVVTLTLTGVLG